MLLEPNCYTRSCKHYQGTKNFAKEVEGDERHVCAAFPDGIPEDITYGDNPHLFSQPGDNGIVFEEGEPEDEDESDDITIEDNDNDD